jgi:outer membrane receptor protein involved in Fe transport
LGSRFASVSVFTIFFIVQSAASAQPAPPSSPESPPPEPPAAAKEVEVEVQGVRPLRAERRTASDFRVDRELIEAAPRKEGADVLRTAPGLSVGRGEGPAVAHSYTLRGFDAEHGQDIEFRVGGLPINQPSHVHGQGYADLGFLIEETVRELRVSEGVYDPKQGDFAVAGTIDIELGVDDDERGIVLRSGYGSWNTFRQLVLWAPEDAQRETFGAVQYGRSDGYGEHRAGESASGTFQYGFGAGPLRYRAIGILHAARADLAGVVRKDDIDSGRVCYHCAYPYETARSQNAASSRALLGFFIEYRAQSGANAELGFFLDRSHFRLEENFTGFTTRPGSEEAGSDLVEQLNRAQALGMTSRYRTAPYRPSPTLEGTVEVGAEGRFDVIDQAQGPLDPADPEASQRTLDAGIHGFELGVYGDLDFRFSRIVKARVGFRGDAVSYDVDDHLGAPSTTTRSAFGVALGPRTSVQVAPLSWLSLFAAYGEGFRSPQATVLEDDEAPFTKVRSADVGARFDWGDPLKLSVGGYVTRLSDDVLFDAEEATLERIGPTQRLGAVVTFLSRPTDWLVESLSMTLVEATMLEPAPATPGEPEEPFEMGQKVPFVPPLVVRADLGAVHTLFERVGPERLDGRAGLGFSFLAPRPLPAGERTAPVALLDASVGLAWGPVDLGLEVTNLLDRGYAEEEHVFVSDWDEGPAETPEPARHLAAGAPRAWMATLGLRL